MTPMMQYVQYVLVAATISFFTVWTTLAYGRISMGLSVYWEDSPVSCAHFFIFPFVLVLLIITGYIATAPAMLKKCKAPFTRAEANPAPSQNRTRMHK